MTPRLPILIPVIGGVAAAMSLRNLLDMGGPWSVFWGALACVGFGLVVAFLAGWPEVREEKGGSES